LIIDSPEPLLTVELLPEVGGDCGIYLQRARVLPDGPTAKPILGTGISLNREVALAKAVCEAVERLTIQVRAPTGGDISIHINGCTKFPTLVRDSGDARYQQTTLLSSACHTTADAALRAVVVEAIERKHLMQWCSGCANHDEVLIAELDLTSEAVPETLRRFLLSKPFRFILSWGCAFQSIPTLVCLAIHHEEGYFHAASAAAIAAIDALESVLLDCAKVLLMEQHSARLGRPSHFRHPSSILPVVFRQRLERRLPALDLNIIQTTVQASPLDLAGFEHSTPWTKALGYHVFSVSSRTQVLTTDLLECFR
jgi:hypothetical protein